MGKQIENIPVVYYHSTGLSNPDWTRNFLTVETEVLKKHFEFITKNYNSISLKEFYEIRNELRNPVKDPIVITFDDGYLDNWIWAFPLLKIFGLKAAIFVSPEFVDKRNIVRPNLEDYQTGNAEIKDLSVRGFLSWPEMLIMENSGYVDIQSHTLTHTKYFISDRIRDFHHPGADILYPAGNLFPEMKPYYIGNRVFERLLPYGYPIFEERSAVISKQVFINQDFTDDCVSLFRNYDFKKYQFISAMEMIKPLYDEYREKGGIVNNIETEEDYLSRIKEEIYGSKKIIEENLGKKTEFLCWPHGDNNDFLHKTALEAGYLMTTAGKAEISPQDFRTRIPQRLGIDFSTWKKKRKTILKLNAFSGRLMSGILLSAYRFIRI